jgi:hypothetical protein
VICDAILGNQMFGIFNRKKKIVNEIALTVVQIVGVCFVGSKYIDKKNNFKPPRELWDDSYVLGFMYGLSGLFLHFNFSGSSMKTTDKGHIILLVLANICGSNYSRSVSIVNEAANSRQNKGFNLGVEHSATTYSALCGHVREDDDEPLLLKAKSLIKVDKDLNIQVPKFLKTLDKSRKSRIGAAVIKLTIMKHIKNKYI